jgi:carnitine-CoA ligase
MNADPRVPPRDQVVLRYLLERRAAEDPERVFAVFDGGPVWTRGELLAQVRRTAAELQSLGSARTTTSSAGCRTARR